MVRLPILKTLAMAAILPLTACGDAEDDARPKAKPAQMQARIASPGTKVGEAPLSLARVSTKSGEILILEPDGTVTEMDLDTPAGRDAFAVTEADLAALNANLDLDLGGLVAAAAPPEKTAQEKALEEFAARTQPALPVLREDAEIAPGMFIAAKVDALGDANGLVEVTANLQQGVDADIAFSYATCALAGWARENGAAYGRHIRTLQAERNGKLLIGSAFTMSQDKPLGLRVMETEQTLRDCRARGIPVA
ncbi:hypothetical protein [Paracoccus zeaxanthinifaciens]|uniref:hypothetical protein n=1 Tax=Paracoccus zeaxanthinifaciens TaxID=187400 RepID=UPI0003B419DF|nr:hypothetical protein [Paracoccus zeaxanthinifaciens]